MIILKDYITNLTNKYIVKEHIINQSINFTNIKLEVRNKISKNIKNNIELKDKEELFQIIKNIILIETSVTLILIFKENKIKKKIFNFTDMHDIY